MEGTTGRLRRRGGCLLGVLIIVIFAAWELSRAVWPYSRYEVLGVYQLRNPDGTTEHLTLRADGSFTQILGNQANSGTWEFARTRLGERVRLHEQMIFMSTAFPWKGLIHSQLNVFRCKNGPCLLLDPVADAFYVKESSAEPEPR